VKAESGFPKSAFTFLAVNLATTFRIVYVARKLSRITDAKWCVREIATEKTVRSSDKIHYA